jgi:two-component system sensor histidine kinase KdpD
MACWALGGLGSLALHGHTDLGTQALPLVAAAAAASLWMRTPTLVLACAAATLAFNWHFVEPRGTLNVSLHRDLVLLLTLWSVSLGVALLVGRQRRLHESEQAQRRQAARLQGLGEALRAAPDLPGHTQALQAALLDLGLPDAVLWLSRPSGVVPAADTTAAPAPAPALPEEQRSGLAACAREGQAFGPGTGRYEDQAGWYLPLPGAQAGEPALGAVWVPLPAQAHRPGAGDTLAPAWATARLQAQTLVDTTAQALHRALALQAASQAQAAAQAQRLRYTLLSAISHDHRTPLASILGAASSLRDQGERLSLAQRQRLAAQIVDEAEQLSRLTDNALQLARLDSLAGQLERDWEAPAELLAGVLARVRGRDPQHRLRTRLDAPGQAEGTPLPLLRCNAVLVVQLLENLIDNALKYSPPGSAVEVLCRALQGELLLAVRDRGPGVPPALRSRIFEAFERGPAGHGDGGTRGAGLGLALCRAVAQAHGGSLRYRARAHGGASLECRLPLEPAPTLPPETP